MSDLQIAAVTFGDDAVYGPSGFHGSKRHKAVIDATMELTRVGLLEQRSKPFWRVTDLGARLLEDPVDIWAAFCASEVPDDRRQLLEAVNRCSPVESDDSTYAWLHDIGHGDLVEELAWARTFV